MYNRAFLKAYCEFLDLDLPHILQRYEAEISPVSEKPPRSKLHAPSNDRSLRISPIVIWGTMLMISAIGLFFSRRWITAMFSPYFSHTQVANIPYEPAQPPKPARPAQESAAVETGQAPAAPALTAGELPDSTQTPPASAEGQASSAQMRPDEVPGNPAAAPAADSQAMRLEITATGQCWVSVDRDGTPSIRKVMESGEVLSFDAAESFRIILGNAGGVHLKINGKPARPLGKPGEVVKVLIDRKNLPGFLGQAAG
jgi:cytoskeletal protein RodZ